MGRDSSYSYSGSYWRGSNLPDGRQVSVVGFYSDFGTVRVRLRVHDSAPRISRLTHTVVPGDTLYAIGRFFGETWQQVYGYNRNIIRDPNLIYPGQVVAIPGHGYRYVVEEAEQVPARPVARPFHHTYHSYYHPYYGMYSCGALESLWREVGGNSGSAFIAAEIAMAESGGNPRAYSPTNDYGLWQINGSHGSLATFDPVGNARAAVSISGNGSDWSPWTTYQTGAYIGRC